MNISEQTLKFLSNLAYINSGIYLKKSFDGENFTRIRTVSKDYEAYAEVTVPEVFDKDACFWELNKFINSVNALGGKDADLTFTDTKVIIKDKNKSSFNISYTEPSCLVHPDFSSTHPPMIPDTTFDVVEKDMKNLLDASKIYGLNEIRIFSKDGKIIMQAIDSQQPSSNTFDLEVADGTLNEVYAFKKEFMHILPGDYTINIDHEQVDLYSKTYADYKLKYTILLLERD